MAWEPILPQDSSTGEPGGPIAPRETRAALQPMSSGRYGPLTGYGMAASSTGVSASQLRSMLRYRWTILGVCLLVALPVIVGIWVFVVPQYSAYAEIRVRPIIPRLVFKTDENGRIPFYESYLNTQVSVLRSPMVIQRVLDRPAVQQTRWYQQPPGSGLSKLVTPLERLREVLWIRPRPQTEIIDVSMTARASKDTAVIVNAVLDEYLRYSREASDASNDALHSRLREKVKSLRAEIDGLERVAMESRKKLGTNLPDELISSRQMRIDTLREKRDEIRRELATAKWQLEQLSGITGEAPSTETDEPPAADQRSYDGDPEWRQLNLAAQRARFQQDAARDRFGPQHPTMKQLQNEGKRAELALRTREGQLDMQWQTGPKAVGDAVSGGPMAMTVDGLDRRVQQLSIQETLLQDDLARLEREIDETFGTAQILAREDERLGSRRRLREAVEVELGRREMERNLPGSIEVLSRAYPSSVPSQDRRSLFTVVAAIFGLAAGLGAAFLRMTRGAHIHELGDVPAGDEMPFLGQLPLLRKDEHCPPEDSPVQAEFIRMIRTAVLERLGPGSGQVVLITSAGPHSGKTTVSVMLGRSLAQCGKKVLLVDADLRNPSLSKRFGVEHEPGLIASLRSNDVDRAGIFETETSRLSMIPAGRPTMGSDFELIANGTLVACMAQWRQEYDIIVLDSSPVLPVADARILSHHADGTIMVVRAEHCRRPDVMEALTSLSSAGARLLGTVFLGTFDRRSHYSHYYGQYYGGIDGTINAEA